MNGAVEPRKRIGGTHCVVVSGREWADDDFDKMSFDSLLIDEGDIMPQQVLPPGVDDHVLYNKRLNVFLKQVKHKPQIFEQMVAYRRHRLEVTNPTHLTAEYATKVQVPAISKTHGTHVCL